MRINYNNATRDSVLDVPLEQVQPFYSSLRGYVDLMTCPENVVTYRMEPGQYPISHIILGRHHRYITQAAVTHTTWV